MTSERDKKPASEAKTTPPGGTDEDQIAQSLKRVYDDVANQPLPDRLVELLDKLKKEDGSA